MTTLDIILGAGGSIAATAGTILGYWVAKKKSNAEIKRTNVDTDDTHMNHIINSYRELEKITTEKLERAHKQVKELEDIVYNLRKYINVLQEVLRKNKYPIRYGK